jgi:transcriptional regulator with XRE-family HTH domain
MSRSALSVDEHCPQENDAVSSTAATSFEPSRTGEMGLRERLGLALQQHRKMRGLSQSKLAGLASISLKYVGEIERGEANPTLGVLERLATALGWNFVEASTGPGHRVQRRPASPHRRANAHVARRGDHEQLAQTLDVVVVRRASQAIERAE